MILLIRLTIQANAHTTEHAHLYNDHYDARPNVFYRIASYKT